MKIAMLAQMTAAIRRHRSISSAEISQTRPRWLPSGANFSNRKYSIPTIFVASTRAI
jgi:hypothetical protein